MYIMKLTKDEFERLQNSVTYYMRTHIYSNIRMFTPTKENVYIKVNYNDLRYIVNVIIGSSWFSITEKIKINRDIKVISDVRKIRQKYGIKG